MSERGAIEALYEIRKVLRAHPWNDGREPAFRRRWLRRAVWAVLAFLVASIMATFVL